MNDTDCKLLCEKIGLVFHEPRPHPDGESIYCICGEIHWQGYDNLNPTFKTWQDFGLCVEYLNKTEQNGVRLITLFLVWLQREKGIQWFMWELKTPAERCELILQFLKETK